MGKQVARRELRRLMSLPWTIELRRNHDGTFSGRIVELPGCMTEGEDEVETLEHLREALELWLETELERGRPIPKPGEHQNRITSKVRRRRGEGAAARR